MQSSGKQSDIRSQLKYFLEIAKLFGLTPFTYDCSKRRVKYVKNRFSRLMLVSLNTGSYLTISFVFVVCITLIFFQFDRQSWLEISSVAVQDLLLMMWYFATEYVCFGLLTRNLLKARRLILPIINEMLKIYAALEKRTNSTLTVSRYFKVAVTARALILIFTFSIEFGINLILSVFLVGLLQIGGTFLTAIALMAHLYSQLVLISFYSKMSEFLQVHDLHMSKEEFSKNVQVLLTLSFRIHRVKSKLNVLCSPVFVTVFFGLSFGIFASYNTGKQLISENKWNQDGMGLLSFSSWLCVNFVVIIYDLYLISCLSDELIAKERHFMRSIVLLIYGNKLSNVAQISWEINQIMIRSEVFTLKSMLFQLIDLDKPFVLSYLYYMVVQYIIMCLQYYIRANYTNTGSVQRNSNSLRTN